MSAAASTTEAFSVETLPLDSLRLIEASAGTGKTYSLAGLYLRLLLEQHADVRQILVMTYTRAATQELRDRIRQRIAEAARIAVDPDLARPGNNEDALAQRLIAAAAGRESREQIARRLREAAARMDDATISTIHAFAQAATRENAFESALPFARGSQVDDRALRLEVVTDYWRSHTLGRSEAQARAFMLLWQRPEDLDRDLGPALDRPHLALPREPIDLDERIRAVRAHWQQGDDRKALRELLERALTGSALLKNGELKQRLNSVGDVEALLAEVDTGLAGIVSGLSITPDWLVALSAPEGIAKSFTKAAMGERRGKARANRDDIFRPQDIPAVAQLAALDTLTRAAARRRACDAIRQTLRARKRSARQFSFADMIEGLHAAITDPTSGKALADALHDTWPWALVDEFQDTDPLQYGILQAIYQHRSTGALIMIGDPKQAIYGFRGGDVFAYLAAARDAAGRYGLDTNFRSTPQVLTAIEQLFTAPETRQSQQGEFLIPEIRFQSVSAGRSTDDRVVVTAAGPLPAVTAWLIEEQNISQKEARQRLLAATVAQIHRLLHPDSDARIANADGSRDRVKPQDIAVLVNTNAEAATVQQALARRGIAAVCLQRADVFTTSEATDLLHLLHAAESAGRPDSVRGALVTPLFGRRLGDFAEYASNEQRWRSEVDEFQQARERWRSRGVLALLEPLLQDAARRLLALDDGERRMTNYLQLAELLAEAEPTTFGMAGLIRWLTAQIEAAKDNDGRETSQLRLESDDELVRIATVHRVKGLQYGIVFLPYLVTMGPRTVKAPRVWHDGQGHAWLDFGSAADADENPSQQQATLEARAESLRLLYVALTRAEQAIYLGWGPVKNIQSTALAWLLHGEAYVDPRVVRGNASNVPKGFDGATARSALAAWAVRADGAVVIADLPAPLPDDCRMNPENPPTGTARSDLPAKPAPWSVFSFTGLVAGSQQQHADQRADDEDSGNEQAGSVPPTEARPLLTSPERLPATAAAAADSPLAPARMATPAAAAAEATTWERVAASTTNLPIIRGPAFGTAVHALLEKHWADSWPAPGEPIELEHRQRIQAELQRQGVRLDQLSESARDASADTIARMMVATLHTPLPHIGRLADVPAQRRLAEMEFFLCLDGPTVSRLLTALASRDYQTALAPSRRDALLRGLLNGFIDLVVEDPEGRYWVIDYKTNHLVDDPAGYTPDALHEAIRLHHYDLQYLLYLTALHRHLERTLPDYDPTRHLGGAQYLFLRGLNGTDANTGVHLAQPGHALIRTLADLLAGNRTTDA